MQQMLLDVCNCSPLILIYGNNVSTALRNMLDNVKGDFSLVQLSAYVLHEDSVEDSTRNVTKDSNNCFEEVKDVKINLIPLDLYKRIKEELQPSRRNRYWVWTECDNIPSLDDFNAIVRITSGRVISIDCHDKQSTYEQLHSENMGAWFAFCMTLYDEVEFRVSYQNLGLFLTNVYSFIEYACAKRGDARNVRTARNALGPYFKDILGNMFQLRLLFTTEPFNRADNWRLMHKILESEKFYDLLQLYFNSYFSELNNLRQIKYLVEIEMDKEGL